MLETLLFLIGKGIITGIASKGGQALIENLKQYFDATLAEKIGTAYVKASERYSELENEEIIDNSLEDDPYYENLIYGFSVIDGGNLSDYSKRMNKLFLLEIFKTPELTNQVFNIKLDNIYKTELDIKKDTEEISLGIKDIKKILLNNSIQNNLIHSLSSYTYDKFLSDNDFLDFPQYYIPRHIAVNTDLFRERNLSSFNELIEYSRKHAENNKITPLRVLIIADGGVGKSIYLKHLAKDCSRNEEFYPVFISLRDLKPNDVLQDYIVRRFPDLKKIEAGEYDQLCFFLDGFDEIGDNASAVKQVDDLCRTYSQSHIILTSRRNSFFNQLPDFLDDFIFTLLDLTSKDIEKYIHENYAENKIDSTHFFKEVSDNNFTNLIYNPFYLDVLINCYITGSKSLNISKKELIDSLITKRREKDKTKRPDLELDKPSVKLKVLQLAKQFAFTQALMDQRSLSSEDIARIFKDDFDLAINSLPIKKGYLVEKEQQWEFEHNIFLEHLVSDVLKELDIEKILEYGSSNGKIKSKWRDIISHLLGILDKSNTKENDLYGNLINWLIKNDTEILLKVEDSQLSQEVRSEIFIQIYEWYQEKTIWLDTNKINIKQMALFGETKENVNRIFNDIVNCEEHYRRRINATLIFKHFSLMAFSDKDKDSMGKQYISAICNIRDSDSEYKETLESHLIQDFPFKNKNLLEEIIKKYRTTSSSQIMSSILYLIETNNLQDKCIETVIDYHIRVEQHQTTGNFHVDASLCLLKMKEESSFIKYFNALLDENLYYLQSSYGKDEFKTILKNCTNYSSVELIKSVINLSSKHASWSSLEEWVLFSPFYENEEIRSKSITILLGLLSSKTQDEMSYWMFNSTLARIIKAEDLPHIFEKIDNQELYTTIVRFATKESEVYTKVLEHLKVKYKYEPVEHIDPWPERRKDEFNILFEKERFKKESFALFDELGNSFIPSELYKEEMKGKYWNNSILAFMRWFVGRGEITRPQLETWFIKNSDYFDFYLNMRISNNLPRWNSNGEMPNISKDQLGFIKTYYDKRINEISFLLTINKEKENTYSMSPIASILINYMQRFEFDCPDNKLCEMLGNFNADFNLIVKKISDKKILTDAILGNLDNYSEFVGSRIFDMSKYCIDNNIHEALAPILEIIKDPNFDDYQKTYIITYCIEKSILVENIINISSYLTQSQILDLCEKLLQAGYHDKRKIRKILYDTIENSENKEHKLSAISLLVWQKEEKALRLLIDYCYEHSVLALDDPFNNIRVARNDMPDNYLLYDDIKLLPLLMEFLEFSLKPEILPKNRGNSKIERNIIHLALLSEDNYIEVVMTLEEFIEKNKETYKDVEFLNFTINRIHEQYKEKNAKRYTFNEAFAICKVEIN